MPSSRQLAVDLGVSRNTIVLVYENLVLDEYLVSRERQGYFVNDDLTAVIRPEDDAGKADVIPLDGPDWAKRFRVRPTKQANIAKPGNWESYPYPFIYGQADPDLFPIGAWRECSRQAMGKRELMSWASDTQDRDDPLLVEQIRERLLPRRGIYAAPEEILVTVGAQNAIYLAASLLVTRKSVVAFEEPGYPDARNIFGLRTNRLLPIAVDEHGLPVTDRLALCDYLYVTPSHQMPTTVTLPLERRTALLEMAISERFLLIEDDYESETNYLGDPVPSLKSLDTANRVIYISTLSKTLCPGLRLGYMVGPPEFIAEARALRRLMLRHPPSNIQRTLALFLSLGHHDSHMRRLQRVFRERWEELRGALEEQLPGYSKQPTFGGTSCWMEGPETLDADAVAESLLADGVIIEPGKVFYGQPEAPANFFRLGFSSIPVERIEPGVRLIAEHIRRLTS